MCTHTNTTSMAIFHVNPGYPSPALSNTKPMGISGAGFLNARKPFHHPRNSIKAKHCMELENLITHRPHPFLIRQLLREGCQVGSEQYRYWGIGQYLPVLGGIGIGPILFLVIVLNTGQTTVCGTAPSCHPRRSDKPRCAV